MNKNFPIRDYKGKHWTQLPGGKEKMAAAQQKHWATRRARSAKLKAMSKEVVKQSRIGVQPGTIRGPYKRKQASVQADETVLSINGWRVTLGRNTVRIEHE